MKMPKHEYTAEFKELAVKRAKEGLTPSASARENLPRIVHWNARACRSAAPGANATANRGEGAAPSAPVKARKQHGASPCRGSQSLVAEGNCVIVRWGGEQPEVNWRSAGLRTRFGWEWRRAC